MKNVNEFLLGVVNLVAATSTITTVSMELKNCIGYSVLINASADLTADVTVAVYGVTPAIEQTDVNAATLNPAAGITFTSAEQRALIRTTTAAGTTFGPTKEGFALTDSNCGYKKITIVVTTSDTTAAKLTIWGTKLNLPW